MEIALEVFSRRGIGRGGHANIADIAQKYQLQRYLTTSQPVKIWLMKYLITWFANSLTSFQTIST